MDLIFSYNDDDSDCDDDVSDGCVDGAREKEERPKPPSISGAKVPHRPFDENECPARHSSDGRATKDGTSFVKNCLPPVSEVFGTNDGKRKAPDAARAGDAKSQKLDGKERSESLFLRTVPHRAGTYACHIRVPVGSVDKYDDGSDDDDDDSGSCGTSSLLQNLRSSSRDAISRLRRILRASKDRRGSVVTNEDPRHYLSLSRTFYLQAHARRRFEADLRATLRCSLPPGPTPAASIDLDPRSAIVLVNDERTRSFLCFRCECRGGVVGLIRAIDGVLESYGQETYYEEPILHVSVASVRGDLLRGRGATESPPTLAEMEENVLKWKDENDAGGAFDRPRSTASDSDCDDDSEDASESVGVTDNIIFLPKVHLKMGKSSVVISLV
mmetsp:Transcript_36536/g.85407  ORF Transcript_36536/g.85407 Transcript_36536/m.85407 type:complete len:385 (-) Transcript_36536:139-1293(-)